MRIICYGVFAGVKLLDGISNIFAVIFTSVIQHHIELHVVTLTRLRPYRAPLPQRDRIELKVANIF
jgi:hypothetical protein